MNRLELAHVLRAACDVTGDPAVLVIGSQSILGSFDEDDLPLAATASIEVDIAFLDDPNRSKADQVEGVIGELSAFHLTHGFYAEGVHADTAVYLPTGWRERLVTWPLRSSDPARPRFLEPHDLVISKLGAAREKDLQFVDALIRAEMVNVATLSERCALLPDRYADVRERVRSHIASYDIT